MENGINTIKDHIDGLAKEIKDLAEKLDSFNVSLKADRKEQNTHFRNEMNRLLDGTEENPGILKSLDDIRKILDERLPKPEK